MSPPCSPRTPIRRSGRARRPSSTAIVTRRPMPGRSRVSNGDSSRIPLPACRRGRSTLRRRRGEKPPGHLGEVVGAEGEELGRRRRSARRSGPRAAPRSSCRSGSRGRSPPSPERLPPRTACQFPDVAHQGTMISGFGRPPAARRSAAASAMASDLHVANRPGTSRPSRTPRRPSMGLVSRRRRTAVSSSREWSSVALRRSSCDGRNSCSGGSIRRMVTGRPSMAARMRVKSARWSGSRASSAARSRSRPGR